METVSCLDGLYTDRYIKFMDTRTEIMEAALKLMSLRGYEAVGVQEICEASRITKPSLYHHFGSKAGLLEALLKARLEPYLDLVREAGTYRHDITRNLNELCSGWFRLVMADPGFARFYLVLASSGQDSEPAVMARRWLARMEEILVELFRQASEDHGNMRNRQERYAASFQGMLDAHTRLAVSRGLRLTDDMAYPAVHQFMHGIFS